jgi:hypothetical protein
MPYSAEISREFPTCIIFLIDLSTSMGDEIETGVTKASFLADALNRSLMELVVKCRKQEGVLNYFDVGVISYAGDRANPGFGGALSGIHICDIASLAKSPLRVETRQKKVPDGAGGLASIDIKFPVWFDAVASGGTPMRVGMQTVASLVGDWCREHDRSFPPTIIHVTDGEPTDGTEAEVEQAAANITDQGTGDGKAVLLNLHVSAGGAPVRFPANEAGLRDSNARMLFRMSSILPPEFQRRASEVGVVIPEGGRGYIYNAKLEDILTFFEIGTRPRLGGPDR